MHVVRYNSHVKSLADAKAAVVGAVRTAPEGNTTAGTDTACVVEYLGYSERRLMTLQEAECYLQQ